jgi:hypothetical protein
MSVWGAQRIKSLRVSPVQVLPTINRLLSRAVPIIAHEINLAIRRLITKYVYIDILSSFLPEN